MSRSGEQVSSVLTGKVGRDCLLINRRGICGDGQSPDTIFSKNSALNDTFKVVPDLDRDDNLGVQTKEGENVLLESL